jgi:hypothetical protein
LARLLRVNTEIVSTNMAPTEFDAGFGVQVLSPFKGFDNLLAAIAARSGRRIRAEVKRLGQALARCQAFLATSS